MTRGSNLSLALNGVEGTYGFYANRLVRARNEEEARKLVLKAIENELAGYGSIGPGFRCVVEETERRSLWRSVTFGLGTVRGEGFAFYPEESQDAT